MSAATRERPRRRSRRAAAEGLPLRDHLAELRKRLVISAVAVLVGMVAAFLLTDFVLHVLTEPIRGIAAQRGADLTALNFDSVTGAFELRMRISFTVGLLVAAPVWFAQLWLFLLPALTRKETRYTVGFLSAAVPLFFTGCYTGWALAPHAIGMMASFVPSGAAQFFQYSFYYDFVLKLVFVVGIAFVLPVLLVLLNLAGVISARGILRGWRIALIVATLFAALATPAADVVSMLVLAVVLMVLYLAAAGVAWIFDRRRSRRLRDTLEESG